jgi:hypothetical protein
LPTGARNRLHARYPAPRTSRRSYDGQVYQQQQPGYYQQQPGYNNGYGYQYAPQARTYQYQRGLY